MADSANGAHQGLPAVGAAVETAGGAGVKLAVGAAGASTCWAGSSFGIKLLKLLEISCIACSGVVPSGTSKRPMRPSGNSNLAIGMAYPYSKPRNFTPGVVFNAGGTGAPSGDCDVIKGFVAVGLDDPPSHDGKCHSSS